MPFSHTMFDDAKAMKKKNKPKKIQHRLNRSTKTG